MNIFCFQDQRAVEYIPCTNGAFTVEKYELFLSKFYSKADLHFCNVSCIFVENSDEKKVVLS